MSKIMNAQHCTECGKHMNPLTMAPGKPAPALPFKNCITCRTRKAGKKAKR